MRRCYDRRRAAPFTRRWHLGRGFPGRDSIFSADLTCATNRCHEALAVSRLRTVDWDSVDRPFSSIFIGPEWRGRLRRRIRSRLRRFDRQGRRRGRRWRGRRCGRRWRSDSCRRRRGSGLRSWRGRRHGCRRRGGGTSRREQGQRVDIRVAVSNTHAEMDVRHVVLRLSRRPGFGNRVALIHVHATLDEQRAEMGQRSLVPVARDDRDGQAMRGNLACKGDPTSNRRPHLTRIAKGDVHAAVLPTGVGIVCDREVAKDWAVSRPRPGPRSGRDDECPRDRCDTSDRPSCCRPSEHAVTVAPCSGGGNAIDELVTESRDTGRSWRPRSTSRPRLPPSAAAPQRRRARQRPRDPHPPAPPSERFPPWRQARS